MELPFDGLCSLLFLGLLGPRIPHADQEVYSLWEP